MDLILVLFCDKRMKKTNQQPEHMNHLRRVAFIQGLSLFSVQRAQGGGGNRGEDRIKTADQTTKKALVDSGLQNSDTVDPVHGSTIETALGCRIYRLR